MRPKTWSNSQKICIPKISGNLKQIWNRIACASNSKNSLHHISLPPVWVLNPMATTSREVRSCSLTKIKTRLIASSNISQTFSLKNLQLACLTKCFNSKEIIIAISMGQTLQLKKPAMVYFLTKVECMILSLTTSKTWCRCWTKKRCRFCTDSTSTALIKLDAENCNRWSMMVTSLECLNHLRRKPF